MRSQIGLQTFDTSTVGFGIVANSFVNVTEASPGYATRVLLGARAIRNTFGTSSPRSLITVRSLPYAEGTNAAFALAERSGIAPARVVSLGDHCAAIIDGLSMAASFAQSGLSPVALVAADHFSEVVDARASNAESKFSEWRNMAGCMRVEKGGRLRLKAIASISNPAFSSMTTFNGAYLQVDRQLAAAFKLIDLDAQIETIQALIRLSDVSLGQPFLCVTNRSMHRLEALASGLKGAARVVQSRDDHGHTGGSDILLNLMYALDSIADGTGNIICSANGLGYTWSSLLIEVHHGGE